MTIGKKILFIPDGQVRKDVPLDHWEHIGKYIVHKKPDIIVNAGDFFDMPSLSDWDKGTKKFEGRAIRDDIAVGNDAMDILLDPLKSLQKQQRQNKVKQYKPRMVYTCGNHEQRIERAVNKNRELEGFLSYDLLNLKDWEFHDFLVPVDIEGICFVHYLANPFTGKPYGGTVLNQLKHAGKSFVCGHKQTLDIVIRPIVGGQMQIGMVAGACYQHDEDYKGPQGNTHFRGVVMLHEAKDGSALPMPVSLDYLRQRYA